MRKSLMASNSSPLCRPSAAGKVPGRTRARRRPPQVQGRESEKQRGTKGRGGERSGGGPPRVDGPATLRARERPATLGRGANRGATGAGRADALRARERAGGATTARRGRGATGAGRPVALRAGYAGSGRGTSRAEPSPTRIPTPIQLAVCRTVRSTRGRIGALAASRVPRARDAKPRVGSSAATRCRVDAARLVNWRRIRMRSRTSPTRSGRRVELFRSS